MIIFCLGYLHDIDTPLDKFRNTALCIATQCGHQDVVEYILGRNPIVDYITDLGRTPLQIAAGKENTDLSRLLLERGAKVNWIDENGITPIFWALGCNNSIEQIKLFIKYHADLNKITFGGETVLHAACSCEKGINLDICELLLKSGCNPNIIDDQGFTALHYAIKLNQSDPVFTNHIVKVAKLFIKYGTDLDIKISSGDTVLHTSAKLSYCSIPLMKVLINGGANTGISNEDQNTFLNCLSMVKFDRAKKFLKYLLIQECKKRFVFNDNLKRSIHSDIELSKFESSCRNELKALFENKVVSKRSTTLFDLLISDSTKLARYCHREEFRIVLTEFEPQRFKIFGMILLKFFKSGLKRYEAEEEAANFLMKATHGIASYHTVMRIISKIPIESLETLFKYE